MFQQSLAQVMGKPVDTDRTRSLQGDEFEFSGFIEVVGDGTGMNPILGMIHYAFSGPALVGQALSAFANPLPASAGMVDIDFPCRFTERPVHKGGYEHGDNSAGGSPMVASVVSWRTGTRAETGQIFYDGVRIQVTPVGA